MAKYIYQHENWTDFNWDNNVISSIFGEVRHLQGKLVGKIQLLGFSSKEDKQLETLTLDVLKSSEIEGVQMNYEQVRSSIARRLGINTARLVPSARNVEGVVEMMLDATQNFQNPLTEERLFGWHAALFPSGFSGMYKIEVAKYRTGEMQVVSGATGIEKVHYEAIPAKDVQTEMDKFLSWLNDDNNKIDNVLRAAIAHFWFVIIHPFDDGNGRIARAISDMLLARSEKSSERFYSLSNQILAERNAYYKILKKSQHSQNEITGWLMWFLNCLKHALLETDSSLQNILEKSEFWEKRKNTPINERQRLIINKLFDDFFGVLNSSKYAKINKVSTDTALRDLQDLVQKGILKVENRGKKTNYLLAEPL